MSLTIALILLHIVVWVLLVIGICYYRKIANTDEITSMWNYRWFYRYLNRKFPSFHKNNKQLSIAIIDIDNFRAFNKINIHTGDEVLNEFAYETNNLFAKEAIITRYRLGDEFAIIFLNKNKEEVIAKMQFLCNYFDTYSFISLPDGYVEYRISFCYGVSELNKGIIHVDDLLLEAEAELAKAKTFKQVAIS